MNTNTISMIIMIIDITLSSLGVWVPRLSGVNEFCNKKSDIPESTQCRKCEMVGFCTFGYDLSLIVAGRPVEYCCDICARAPFFQFENKLCSRLLTPNEVSSEKCTISNFEYDEEERNDCSVCFRAEEGRWNCNNHTGHFFCYDCIKSNIEDLAAK